MTTLTELWQESNTYTEPFKHVIINNIFPSNILQEIIKNLPNDSKAPVANYYPYGKVYAMGVDDCVSNKFWSSVHRFFNSTDVLEFVENKLDLNFKLKEANLSIHYDYKGEQLGPHVDALHTLIIFLSEVNDPMTSGTDYYVRQHSNWKDNKIAKWSLFSLFKTIPAILNTGHLFEPAENSWHGYYNLGEDRRCLVMRFK